MYKILPPSVDDKLQSVLLNNEADYLSYIKDKNYIDEEGFKRITFGKPKSYPAILVTYFDISMCKFIPHTIYGVYTYPSSFK